MGDLFEPFFTTKPAGTGLGLWMSKDLIEGRGGSLTYQRKNDKTIFRVRLPRTPDGAKVEAPVEPFIAS